MIPFFLDFIYLFLERGEGKEKERERNISVWLPLTCPQLGIWPATQACALTGNRTEAPLVLRPALIIHWPHQPVLIAFFDGKKCMCIYICMLENN